MPSNYGSGMSGNVGKALPSLKLSPRRVLSHGCTIWMRKFIFPAAFKVDMLVPWKVPVLADITITEPLEKRGNKHHIKSHQIFLFKLVVIPCGLGGELWLQTFQTTKAARRVPWCLFTMSTPKKRVKIKMIRQILLNESQFKRWFQGDKQTTGEK